MLTRLTITAVQKADQKPAMCMPADPGDKATIPALITSRRDESGDGHRQGEHDGNRPDDELTMRATGRPGSGSRAVDSDSPHPNRPPQADCDDDTRKRNPRCCLR